LCLWLSAQRQTLARCHLRPGASLMIAALGRIPALDSTLLNWAWISYSGTEAGDGLSASGYFSWVGLGTNRHKPALAYTLCVACRVGRPG